MKRSNATTIHGVHELDLTTRSGKTLQEFVYIHPEPIDVRIADGVTMRGSRVDEVRLAVSRLPLPAPEDAMEPTNYMQVKSPESLQWLMRVIAAQRAKRNLIYKPASGGYTLVLCAIPERALELELLRHGFTPRMASWSGRPDAWGHSFLLEVARRTPHTYRRPESWGQAPATPFPTDSQDELEHRAEHAWLRWCAVFDDWIRVGGRTFYLRKRPVLDLQTRELRFHFERLRNRRGDERQLQVRLRLDVHPLIYPAALSFGTPGKRSAIVEQIAGLAWEDMLDLPRVFRDMARRWRGPAKVRADIPGPTPPALAPAAMPAPPPAAPSSPPPKDHDPKATSVEHLLRGASITLTDNPLRSLHGLTVFCPRDGKELAHARDVLLAAGLAPVTHNRRLLVRDRRSS